MKIGLPVSAIMSVIASLFFISGTISAQWSTSPTVNNAVTSGSGMTSPTIVSDDSGDTLVMWYEGTALRVQRLSTTGIRRWGPDGVYVSQLSGSQLRATMVSDGSGGAIVTWQFGGYPSYSHIYAQRINAAGVAKWPAAGVPICTATGGDQYNPTIASDKSGGAIITWRDQRNGLTDDVYAQRVDSSGNVLWTANGVAVSTATGYQNNPAIISSDNGEAIIAWEDSRNGVDMDIYAQRMSAAGTALWTANGVAIATLPEEQSFPMMVGDGFGGAIIAWQDFRNTANYDVYAQRVSSSGVVQWATNGAAVGTAAGFQQSRAIAADDSGGAIMAWDNYYSGESNIYAGRINAVGVIQWSTDGIPICTATGTQNAPVISGDGFGGAYIAWTDYRSGGNPDIYSQRVNSSGGIQWIANGVGICTQTGSQSTPTIVRDGTSGAIMAWVDSRGIYASRVNSAGALGGTSVAIEETDDQIPQGFALMQNYPNPFNPETGIRFQVSGISEVSLRVYDLLGREVAVLVNGEQHPGTYTVTFDASRLTSGIYFYRLTAGTFSQTKKLLLTK